MPTIALCCFALGFNLSPQLNFNSGSNGRLGVSVGCMSIDVKSTARAQPDPAQNKATTINQALCKTTSVCRVPEVHGGVGPLGRAMDCQARQLSNRRLTARAFARAALIALIALIAMMMQARRVLSEVNTHRHLTKSQFFVRLCHAQARAEQSHFETRLLWDVFDKHAGAELRMSTLLCTAFFAHLRMQTTKDCVASHLESTKPVGSSLHRTLGKVFQGVRNNEHEGVFSNATTHANKT
jgi:hypothetical protein